MKKKVITTALAVSLLIPNLMQASEYEGLKTGLNRLGPYDYARISGTIIDLGFIIKADTSDSTAKVVIEHNSTTPLTTLNKGILPPSTTIYAPKDFEISTGYSIVTQANTLAFKTEVFLLRKDGTYFDVINYR